MALTVGIIFGFVYFFVDFGVFNLMLHTRSISPEYSMFWVLLWMSMSYGFTNFSWIWLWMEKDPHLLEWSLLILTWWFTCPLIATSIGTNKPLVTIQRTTSSYHGFMAGMLFVGYLILILYNLQKQDKDQRMPIPWLLAIGILVQFGWEAALLVGGIRSAVFTDLSMKLQPLIVNSLLETNLGMPYICIIFISVTRRFTETFHRREPALTFEERIIENNRTSVRKTS